MEILYHFIHSLCCIHILKNLNPWLFLFFQEQPTPLLAPDVSDPVDKEETDDLVQSCSGGQVFSREEQQAIGGAIERLGLQLLQNLPIGPQQPNVILSPLSVAFGLAQLALGQSVPQVA